MISVIVPVYNVEKYLSQCLDSILAQTERDLEIILIDDGSTDGSGGICDRYGETDARVRVFHTENRGLSAARNLGMKEAAGEYIGFVDSDDWIESDMFEVMLRRLSDTDSDVCVCSLFREYFDRTDEQKNGTDMVMNSIEAVKAVVLGPLGSFAWNKLYRTDVIRDILFPEGHVYEDVYTTYRFLLNAGKIVYIPAPLYHYRLREDSITGTHSMGILKDDWDAYYSRMITLLQIAELRDDTEFRGKLRENLAGIAARIWRWIWSVPKSDRDSAFLEEIASYARSSIPFFGEKNWSLYLRVFSPFLRYPNDLSFFIVYCTVQCYQFIFRNKGFQ